MVGAVHYEVGAAGCPGQSLDSSTAGKIQHPSLWTNRCFHCFQPRLSGSIDRRDEDRDLCRISRAPFFQLQKL